MQKVLTDAQAERVGQLIALCELGAQFYDVCECPCCGSRDALHDHEACNQAAYVGFDLWRSELMDAGLWNGRNAMGEEEYSEALAREYCDEEEEYAPDFSDEDFFRSDRLVFPTGVCPAMGLY